MHDETKERMHEERETARRAECFARLVLADREDHDGRKLLDYAERTANRLPMQWEKRRASPGCRWRCAATASTKPR